MLGRAADARQRAHLSGPRGGGPLAASSAAGPPADSGTDTTLDQIGASLRGLGVGEPGSTPPGLNLGMLRGAPGGGGMSGSLGGLGPGAGGPAPGASEWYAHLPDDLGLGGGGGAGGGFGLSGLGGLGMGGGGGVDWSLGGGGGGGAGEGPPGPAGASGDAAMALAGALQRMQAGAPGADW